MKKIIIYFIILCVAIALAGCGKSKLTQLDITANDNQAKATEACYKARQIDFTNIPKEAIGYIVMSKQFGDALLAVTGNDPCRSTNVFDVQIAEVQAKNKALSSTTSGLFDLGMFAVGASVLNNAFDAAGDVYTASDNGSIGVSNYSASSGSAVMVDTTLGEGASVSPEFSSAVTTSIEDNSVQTESTVEN